MHALCAACMWTVLPIFFTFSCVSLQAHACIAILACIPVFALAPFWWACAFASPVSVHMLDDLYIMHPHLNLAIESHGSRVYCAFCNIP